MENKTQQKVQFKESPIHGWGVFATQDINKDEIIGYVLFCFFPQKEERLTTHL
jgi:SET domain-containing protein